MDKRNTNISTGSPTGISAEVHKRDVTELPNVSTSTAATTPVILDVEPIGTSSPKLVWQKGLHPILLLQPPVDLGHGCNKLQKDKLMNQLEKAIQMKVIHQM